MAHQSFQGRHILLHRGRVEEFPKEGEDSESSLGFDAPVVAHSGSSVSRIVRV